MPRVNAWSSYGDQDPTPASDEPPAVIRLDPAGPGAVQQRTRDASVYLTRDNPLSFITEESDAQRIASTSRWLTVDAVGIEEIREKYGDEADTLIPSTYEARSDIDEDSPEAEAEIEAVAGNEDADGGYTRAQLDDMDWPDLQKRAIAADTDELNGHSSREEIVEHLAEDVEEIDRETTGADPENP